MANKVAAKKTTQGKPKASAGVTRTPTRTPARKSAVSTTARRLPRAKDACDLLDADHKAVKKMFDDFKTLAEGRSRSTAKKRELADQICLMLTVHAAIEEEIFYPAAYGVLKEQALLNEAAVEHASVKDLMAQIREMDEADEMFDAKVMVLGEYVDHHVKEERGELFPLVRQSRLDLVAMREALQTRKEELMAETETAEAV
jgi:hemerythrin superfamily protein